MGNAQTSQFASQHDLSFVFGVCMHVHVVINFITQCRKMPRFYARHQVRLCSNSSSAAL